MDYRGCFSVVSWNCNGITGKILELREFIKEHSPDIVLLQETHLRPGNTLKVPNYTSIRHDFINPNSSRPIRGTAILVKNHLNFIITSLPTLSKVDAVGITLCIPNTPQLTFFSVYVPNHESASDITRDISALLHHDVNSMLIGDFNAHHTLWNCSHPNDYGLKIHDLLLNSPSEIIFPDSPTHFTSSSSSTIDFGIYNGFNYYKEISSLPDLSSDHNPIKMLLQIKPPSTPLNSINKTNWTQYQDLLSNFSPIPDICTTSDIDQLVANINDEIISAKNTATTKITQNDFYRLDPHVRRLTKNKNRARKIWQRSRNPFDKIIMNRAQQDLKNYLSRKSQENWTDFLESLDPETGSIWKAARKFKTTYHGIPPILIPNSNSLATSEEEKADAIAVSLVDQFQGNPIISHNTESEVNSTINDFLSSAIDFPTFQISAVDVFKEINSLKNRKAPGVSGITNEMLKNLPTVYIRKITCLINAILNFNYFPSYWKTAIIAPILKSGKPPNVAKSYRPISLLDSISKLTEVFIARQINKHISDNNILSDNQFGFRSQLSAPAQIYRLVEHITTGKTEKKVTAAVFLDIEKAFDRVWVRGLLYKLLNYNFPPHLVKLIYSYTKDRNFHVRVKNSLSRNYFASFGLSQGSKISPILFNLFINDMPCHPQTHLALFADDAAVYAIHRNRRYAILALTKHLKLITDWCDEWRIALNFDKTQAILFSNQTQATINKLKIKINNNEIPWSDNCKYLGVTLDRRLTFKSHISNSIKKFRAVRSKLYPLISRNSILSIDNKLLLYKSYLRPILTYASEVWSHAAKKHIISLIQSQNSTVRQILDMPYYVRNFHIYKEINLPTLNDFILHLVQNFHNSLSNTNNSALKTLPAYDHTLIINRKRPKSALILNSHL